MRELVVLLLIVGCVLGVSRPAGATDLDGLVARYLGGDDAALDAIAPADRQYGAVAESLARLPVPEGGQRGTFRTQLTLPGGGETGLLLTVPEGLGLGLGPEPAPLLVALHGMGGRGEQVGRWLEAPAARYGFILACPDARLVWDHGPQGEIFSAVAYVKRHYPVDPDRVYLMGASMGAFAAWNASLRFPDRFAALIPIAGGVSPLEFLGGTDLGARRLLRNALHLPVFMIHGDADRVVPPQFDRRTHRELTDLGYEHVYREIEGLPHVPKDRGWIVGAMDEVVEWALPRRRDAYPRRIVYVARDRLSAGGYWMEIVDRTPGERFAEVAVEVVGPNRIRVEGSGVAQVALLLCDRIPDIDLDRPVTVVSSGRVVHEGLVARDATTLLDYARRWDDAGRIASARLVVPISAGGAAGEAGGGTRVPCEKEAAPPSPRPRRWH